MRAKLLAAAVVVLALGVSSASASAETLQLRNGNGEAAKAATFSGAILTIEGGPGLWSCGGFDLQTKITRNYSDPDTLESTKAGSTVCEAGGFKKYFSEIKTTGPMTLSADGTGELPLSAHSYYPRFGYNCDFTGTLDLAWQENGEVSYEGEMSSSGGGACAAESRWTGSFGSSTDEKGNPMEWLVSGEPPLWGYEGSPLLSTHEVSFKGEATIFRYPFSYGTYSCGINGGLNLSTEGSGDLEWLEVETSNCHGTGYLSGCTLEWAEPTAESLPASLIAQAGFTSVDWSMEAHSPCFADTVKGNISLTPDDANAISSFALSGTIHSYGYAVPMEGEIDLEPAGTYSLLY